MTDYLPIKYYYVYGVRGGVSGDVVRHHSQLRVEARMVVIRQKAFLFALGILIGRARLLGGLAPFIPAYVMAAGLRHPDVRIPITAGVIIGILLAGEDIGAGWMIAVAIVAHLAVSGWPKSSSSDSRSSAGPALVVGGIASTARCIRVVAEVTGLYGAYVPYGYDFVPALFDGVLAFLLTLVFMDALRYMDRYMHRGPSSARLVWSAWERAIDRGVGKVECELGRTRGFTMDALKRSVEEGGVEYDLSMAIMLGCALAGLVGVTIGPVRIQGLVVAVATLLASWSLGAAHGTVCGLMLGVIGVLSTGMSPQSVAALGFAGLLAGLFRKWGRVAAATGFLVGLVVLSLAFARSWELMSTLSEGSLASLVLCFIPATRIKAWSQTTGVNDVVCGGANLFTAAHEGPGGQSTHEGKHPNEERPTERKRSLPEVTAVDSAANAVAATTDPFTDRFQGAKSAKKERGLDGTLPFERDLGQVSETTEIPESRRQVAQSVQRLVPRSAAKSERGTQILHYEVGMACYPDPSSGVVSGDYYVARALGDDKVLLALSDGMGIGEKALACSMATVQMIETLIGSGIGCPAAVRAANSIRLFEGVDDAFTTLDLAVVDLKGNKITMSKAGAPPSFLKRGSKCAPIRMESVPLGVMEDFVPEIETVDIEPGDALVMMTDGLLERGDPATAEMWMTEVIADLEESSSAKMAEDVLRQAFERTKDEVKDDMTVLVIKFSDHG
ncbi:MAG TPA: SpoIIE family protein phosphatase [Clostridia bacterium]|nr:SpoIIE family protein phosphatase [Clostridia bacterium]